MLIKAKSLFDHWSFMGYLIYSEVVTVRGRRQQPKPKKDDEPNPLALMIGFWLMIYILMRLAVKG